jgi:hypothetical protein
MPLFDLPSGIINTNIPASVRQDENDALGMEMTAGPNRQRAGQLRIPAGKAARRSNLACMISWAVATGRLARRPAP